MQTISTMNLVCIRWHVTTTCMFSDALLHLLFTKYRSIDRFVFIFQKGFSDDIVFFVSLSLCCCYWCCCCHHHRRCRLSLDRSTSTITLSFYSSPRCSLHMCILYRILFGVLNKIKKERKIAWTLFDVLSIIYAICWLAFWNFSIFHEQALPTTNTTICNVHFFTLSLSHTHSISPSCLNISKAVSGLDFVDFSIVIRLYFSFITISIDISFAIFYTQRALSLSLSLLLLIIHLFHPLLYFCLHTWNVNWENIFCNRTVKSK